MQGLWKDTRKNFVKDKKRAFHRATLGCHGAETKAMSSNHHQWQGWESSLYLNFSDYDFHKFYGYRLGIDLSYRVVCRDIIHSKKHSRRKVAQLIVNSKDRAILRDYLRKADWEKEVPTHCYSKSINWMID